MMFRGRRWREVCFSLALCLVLLPASLSAASGWREDLAIEIRSEHGCEVAYLTHVVERDIDGRQVILAKVHCMDQRSFDATRSDEKEFFSFHECTREETETC